MPVVKQITQEFIDRIEQLTTQIQESESDPSPRQGPEGELSTLVEQWQEKIIQLGCEPKGLWLVDFNNGEGYYCWRHPETELGFFHGYEEGFAGRTPIL